MDKISDSEDLLRRRAAEWSAHETLASLSPDSLRQITRKEGVDFATALLFDRFCASPARSRFIAHINELRKAPGLAPCKLDAKVVIVPGALYRERPDMGGDGRVVREVAASLGLKTDIIPLDSFGSVQTNARLIRKWLEQNQSERIILVSLSKGGADLKLALAESAAGELLGNVIAWVNVCGPLNGSCMADWILASRICTCIFRLKFWWQNRDFKFVEELRHNAKPLDRPLRLPAALTMVSLIGFPLRRHMTSRFSRFCHRTLASHGPNDGTTLLADLADLPGEIYPAWGMDHYFRPEGEARTLVAATIRYLERPH